MLRQLFAFICFAEKPSIAEPAVPHVAEFRLSYAFLESGDEGSSCMFLQLDSD